MIGRLLREPLLHFVALGLLLFIGYRALNPTAGPRPDRIELTADDLRQIEFAWVTQGRQAPTPAQMQALVDSRVREEILYREALALGLEKDDTIVRRRMAQKMEFLFEDVAALRSPTPEEVATWFTAHADRFTRPPRATFRHRYFSPDRRGAQTRDQAAAALATLAHEPMDSPAVSRVGDPFMFQDYYGDRTPEDVAKTFGPGFARALFAIAPGGWAGPIESGYGWHLVWIDTMTPARVPALDEVEAEVQAAWLEEQRAAMRDKTFEAIRARYEVVLPKDPDTSALATLRPADPPPLAGVVPE